MRLSIIDSEEQNLDKLFTKISKLEEDEIKSHLAKYLCVQTSGYLENVIKQLIAEYHDGTCKKSTERFVNDKLKGFTNVDEDKLEKLLKAFNVNWYDMYSSQVSEQNIQSLNSIVSQRHLIAHGKQNLSNISFKNISDYYKDLKEIVKVLRIVIQKAN